MNLADGETYFFNGDVPKLKILGRKTVHVFGGRHTHPIYRSRLRTLESGEQSWRDAMRGSSFNNMVVEDVDDVVFSGGMNGCTFNSIFFRDVYSAFDFRRKGDKGSATWNTLTGCNFRTTGTALITQWPVLLQSCFFEGRHKTRPADLPKVLVADHRGSGSTQWNFCTFERYGDGQALFRFNGGKHYFDHCRFGHCPNAKHIFELSNGAQVFLSRCCSTQFADMTSSDNFVSHQRSRSRGQKVSLHNDGDGEIMFA